MEPFNTETVHVTRANTTLNPLMPKAGVFQVGDKGLAFYAESGQGFIQIPWDTITDVQVQLFFKGRYVRGFIIHTSDNHQLELVVHQAKDTLRAMRQFLPRETFTRYPNNFIQLFRRK